MGGIDRLLAMRRRVAESALEMRQEQKRFRDISAAPAPVAVSSFNLFQTPEHIADNMARMLGKRTRILEPSAGLGRLASAAMGEVVCVDSSPECCAVLSKKWTTHCRDFLTITPDELGMFDGVLMNPPFKMGTDCKHIFHALNFLAPGGKLVGLCYNGSKQNKKLKPVVDTWELLPEGSFKSEGTGASVVLFSITSDIRIIK